MTPESNLTAQSADLYSKFKQLNGLPAKEYKAELISIIDKYQRCCSLKQEEERNQVREMYMRLREKSNMTERFWIDKFLSYLNKIPK